MKAIEIIEKLKANKIAKGCKITYVSNKVYVDYNLHKYLSGQYWKEKEIIIAMFPNLVINCYRLGNTAGINIWTNEIL